MRLASAEVMDRALSWVHVPDGCLEVRTPEFHLVAFPQDWPTPAAVFRLDSARPAAEVVDDVLAAARGLGRDDVTFWVHPRIRPDGLLDELTSRDAVRTEELAVLARPLGGPLDPPLDLGEPAGLELRTADTLDTMRDFDTITAEVFGGPLTTDDRLAADAAGADLSVGLGWVAYRDETAVACAAATVRGDAVRLWGAATRAGARHTGAYRALLAHRLRVASAVGCSLALVTGRLTSSAPILRRAGFEQHGEQTSYRLVLA